MSHYAADGSTNITVVDGSTQTGIYAADGSFNCIVSDGLSFKGRYHPCGAFYVTSSPGGINSSRAPDGSLYVQESPYTSGGMKVTVVSGVL